MKARSASLILFSFLIVFPLLPACLHNPEKPEDEAEKPYIDNKPPTALLVSPGDGSVVSGTVRISAIAADNIGMDHVEFFLDSAQLPGASDDSSPYEYDWDTRALADSSMHFIYAKAFDTSLNTGYSDTIYVTVDNSTPDALPPLVSISYPSDGATVSGTIILIADATDNIGVDHVEFFLNDTQLPGAIDSSPPYEYSWDTSTLANGSNHLIFARAEDTSGNTAYSDTIYVTVDNSVPDNLPPVISMAYPSDGDTVSGTVSLLANATDNDAVYKVEFFIDDALPPDGTDYGYPYEYAWDTNGLADGSLHSIFAKATDTSNNFSYSDTVYVTVYNNTSEIAYTFSVAADMRDYTGDNMDYFRGACEALASVGPGEFMISPGDLDPPSDVLYTLHTYADPNYVWYPIVGNHEAETSSDMSWLRSYNASGNTLPNIVNTGPPGTEETTYSFDYGSAHFVVINEYYDGSSDTGTDGDVADDLYNWLISDLNANTKPIVFVIGHEPAYPMPDEESGRLRHEYDSLNAHESNRNRFWDALVNYGVVAYICGHTHNYSVTDINGVWQIDSGHARGTGDTGARSTFMIFKIMKDGSVVYDTYRLDYGTGEYVLTNTGQLRGAGVAQTALRY